MLLFLYATGGSYAEVLDKDLPLYCFEATRLLEDDEVETSLPPRRPERIPTDAQR
ncbi:MAG: hypothetical protein ACPGKG_06540 [Paracoccaceae bacterium]